ncbi:prohibitin 4 [Iris pallida]|uniref:Prohibitin 4 n=1 Tax=Iris pallida TaxID=29817 RepID=A0AAX6FXX9_IRIPA|nr:prohibitin 4 [Iris pallida]
MVRGWTWWRLPAPKWPSEPMSTTTSTSSTHRTSFTTLATRYMECTLWTGSRFFGGSHGYVAGHVCPEAQEGGPIGLIQNGHIITIDVQKKTIDVELTEEQLAERRKKWTPPPYKATSLYKLWKLDALVID